MSAESPDEQAEPAESVDSESTDNDSTATNDNPAATEDDPTATGDKSIPTVDAESEQSYEEQVLDELVPEISVGDGTVDDEPLDSDPESIAETDLNEDIGDALDELDDDTQQAFIRIVVGIKLGVLLLSAGMLAIGFQGMITLGGGLIAISGLAFARAGYRYWAHEHASDGSHNG
ncbi:MAG: hypothetical protein J07HN4v3_02261 [Halonotius sp. J07HN4]|nr:MAG: hypothetical protein J07HN4v3_02261 [Halonotius sp. J07HN4]